MGSGWSATPNDQIQIVDQTTGQVVIQIGPGAAITMTGAAFLEMIGNPADGRLLDVQLNDLNGTPEIVLAGRGTFPTRKIAVFNMDDLNDQTFRFFMGVSDDVRSVQNQWDLEATINAIVVNGYDTDFFTSTHGLIYDPTAPGALKALVGGAAETWHDVGLLNGWANRAGWDHLSYRLDPTGRVFLRGSISGGTSASGTKIGTVPAGYRPVSFDAVNTIASDNLPAAYAAANGAPRLQVTAAGDLFIYGTGAGPLYFTGFNYSTI